MFTNITLKNYRTHKLTSVDLKPVTLLIGNNNSGKSNFLSGIRHFCHLVRRGRPTAHEDELLPPGAMFAENKDLFFHRYKLAEPDDPMSFSASWEKGTSFVTYSMELFPTELTNERIGCREKISLSISGKTLEITHGWGINDVSNKLGLRTKIINDEKLPDIERKTIDRFFGDLTSVYAYHLQPAFMKRRDEGEVKGKSKLAKLDIRRIASHLGYEGGNFQDLLILIKEQDDRLFQRFIASLRRFERMFHGIDLNKKNDQLFWQFDMKGTLQGFPPNLVSDGLIKAGVISLLTSLPASPAMVLLEEIENGINPGNIQEFIRWIWQASSPKDKLPATQFILTSHSPSVLREFYDHLDHVYTVRLDKHSFASDVRNLNVALDSLVGIGTVEGEFVEEDGKRLVKIPRYELTELWYSGTIG